MMTVEQLSYIKENVLETIQDIDRDRVRHHIIQKDDINRLSVLVETFTVYSKEIGIQKYINEAISFERKFDLLVDEYKYRKDKIINEGFNNPFDFSDDSTSSVSLYDTDPYKSNKKKINITGVRLWEPDVNDKIYYKNGGMFAGKSFAKGDTIEKCPVEILTKSDLYSERIRKFAFSIDPKNGVFAIPFGYASYYRDSKYSNNEANASYDFVSNDDYPYLRVFATLNIKKGDEIILSSDELDYGNEYTPDKYSHDDSFISTKNYKFG